MRTVRQLLDDKEDRLVQVGPEEPVLAALKKMADAGVGSVLVMKGLELVGILSERDYARKVVLLGRTSRETPVAEIMSAPVLTVRCDETTDRCMRLMTDNKFRHLPVIDDDVVVGVVSIGDLVRAVIADQQLEIKQLQSYIAG